VIFILNDIQLSYIACQNERHHGAGVRGGSLPAHQDRAGACFLFMLWFVNEEIKCVSYLQFIEGDICLSV
jgi:hypothetical protein